MEIGQIISISSIIFVIMPVIIGMMSFVHYLLYLFTMEGK